MPESLPDGEEKTLRPRLEDATGPLCAAAAPPEEIGGPKGLEPTRYGDWERGGKCVDF